MPSLQRTVRALLGAGAEVNLTTTAYESGDNRGWTPLDVALHFKREEVAAVLRAAGGIVGQRKGGRSYSQP